MIHGSASVPSPTPAPAIGSATFRIEKSTDSMNPAPSSTSRIARSRPLNRGVLAVSTAVAVSVMISSVSSNRTVAMYRNH